MIRGQETAAKEKSFYQEEEITDKETVSPVDIAGSGQTNGDETAEKEGANTVSYTHLTLPTILLV